MDLQSFCDRTALRIVSTCSPLPVGKSVTFGEGRSAMLKSLTLAGVRSASAGRLLSSLLDRINREVERLDPTLSIAWDDAGFSVRRETKQ